MKVTMEEMDAEYYANYPAPEVFTVVKQGNTERLLELLNSGLFPDALHELTFDTPLLTAIYNGRTEMADILLNYGAKPTHENGDGWNALHAAVQVSNMPIARRLVEEFKMDVNAEDPGGYTLLHRAIRKDDTQMVHFLLQKGASPVTLCGSDLGEDAYYESSLHLLSSDNVGMAAILIQYGADINALDSDGTTPLYMACSKKHSGVALLLLAKGAKTTKCRGRSVVDVAVSKGLKEVVSKLVG
jgi:ankyrin repeat protein